MTFLASTGTNEGYFGIEGKWAHVIEHGLAGPFSVIGQRALWAGEDGPSLLGLTFEFFRPAWIQPAAQMHMHAKQKSVTSTDNPQHTCNVNNTAALLLCCT